MDNKENKGYRLTATFIYNNFNISRRVVEDTYNTEAEARESFREDIINGTVADLELTDLNTGEILAWWKS